MGATESYPCTLCGHDLVGVHDFRGTGRCVPCHECPDGTCHYHTED